MTLGPGSATLLGDCPTVRRSRLYTPMHDGHKKKSSSTNSSPPFAPTRTRHRALAVRCPPQLHGDVGGCDGDPCVVARVARADLEGSTWRAKQHAGQRIADVMSSWNPRDVISQKWRIGGWRFPRARSAWRLRPFHVAYHRFMHAKLCARRAWSETNPRNE